MPNPVEYIDVDDIPDSLSDDGEIVFTGFKRNPAKSKAHVKELEDEGLVYTGFNETPKPQESKTPVEAVRVPFTRGASSETPGTHQRLTTPTVQIPSSGKTDVRSVTDTRAKRAPSDSDAGPPLKQQKQTHQYAATNPQLKRSHAAMRATSRAPPPPSAEVICITDSEDEQPPLKKSAPSKPSQVPIRCRRRDMSVSNSTRPQDPRPLEQEDPMEIDCREEEDYVTAYAALDLDYGPNWDPIEDRDDRLHDIHDEETYADGLSRQMAALSVTNKRPVQDHIRHQQRQSAVLRWSLNMSSQKPHVWSLCRQAPYASHPRTRGWRWQDDFSPWIGLRPQPPMRLAPGNINTIVQHKGIIVVASAVADGALDDTPGRDNREGSLVIWAEGKGATCGSH
ncbi:hypothetical protein OH77DRAFT_459020 [Trametes cingulata]|nr:hypothetical protein OH77DRAFT_459020 [Trametes cingulata]